MHLKGPAPRPCESCPYRRDVPAGIWDVSEYAKLPLYDSPTWAQPPGVFACHQQNGRVCAGWAGTHDMDHSLALRVATRMGTISAEDADACQTYESPVPLWPTGAAAAEHGLADIDSPTADAVRMMAKLQRAKRGEDEPTEPRLP